MYVWQLYHCIRSIVRYIYDHANIGSKMGLISLPMHALVTGTHVLLGTRKGQMSREIAPQDHILSFSPD
jgi:hypothetical protein